MTSVARATQRDKALEDPKRRIFVPGMCQCGSGPGGDGRGVAVPESAAVPLEPTHLDFMLVSSIYFFLPELKL